MEKNKLENVESVEVIETITEVETTNEVAVEKELSVEDKKDNRNFKSNNNRNFQRKPFEKQEKEFEEVVVAINRITKVTKGGRRMRFAALVIVGDRKGRVGFGKGKSVEVPDAIKKAVKQAMKNIVKVKLTKNKSIPHEIYGKWGSSRVLLKPAKVGTGIIAGGAIRVVLELSGIHDIYSKNLGSKAPINKVRATLNGLLNLRLPSDFIHIKSKNTKKSDEIKSAN